MPVEKLAAVLIGLGLLVFALMRFVTGYTTAGTLFVIGTVTGGLGIALFRWL
jgi:hypothetical protein